MLGPLANRGNVPFKKGRRSSDKQEHPLSYLTPQQRWESAIRMFAVMYGNSLSGKKTADQPQTSKTEVRRRPPKPIRLHVQYEDFDGRVWHEHESIYPEPKTADAPAGKPSSDVPR